MKKSVFILSLMATTAFAANTWAESTVSSEDTACGAGCQSCGDNCYYKLEGQTLKVYGPSSTEQTGTVSSYMFASIQNQQATSVEIIGNISTIEPNTFSSHPSLTSISMANSSVTTINNNAFYGLRNLTSLTLPNSLTTVGSSAFGLCNNLTSLTIPSSVTSIGSDAFSEATNLTSVILPDSVTTIGGGAFAQATNLKSLVIPDSVTTITSYGFRFATGTIYCPSQSLCNSTAMFLFKGTTVYYTIDENGVYKVGDTYYASAEDMGRVICTGTTTDSCEASPKACTDYATCKEDALSQMVAKGTLCTTIQGCQNLIAMVTDDQYNCNSLTKCRNAVKAGTYNVNLSEGGNGSTQVSHVGKRIYTVEEARAAVEAAGTDTVNFRIRYK